MTFELALCAYMICAGFVAAGTLASLYQLITNQPARFLGEFDNLKSSVVSVVICTFAGPFILMRNGIRARMIERRPVGWLVATTALASGWSLCSGIVVLQFALAMRHSLI